MYSQKENPKSSIYKNNNLKYMGDFGERVENKRINIPSEEENNSIYSKYKKLKTEYGELKNRVLNKPISIYEVFRNLDDLFNLNKLLPLQNNKIEVENDKIYDEDKIHKDIQIKKEEKIEEEKEIEEEINLNGSIDGITKKI